MQFEQQSKFETIVFDSVGALVQHALDGKCRPENASLYKEFFTNHVNGNRSWVDGYTPDKVREYLENPPESSARVAGLVQDILSGRTCTARRRRVLTRQEYGEELCEVAWIQRDPDGWQRTEKTATEQRVVRIACNSGINACGRKENVWYRGAAVAALADAIESSGVRVEIVGFLCADGIYETGQASSIIQYTVKRPEMPVDVASIALALAEIGFIRLVGIPTFINAGIRKVTRGVGHAVGLPAGLASEFDIVFDTDIYSLAAAQAAVKKYADGLVAPAV